VFNPLTARVKKLEATVADQQAVITLLLSHEGVKVETEPEVYIPEKLVLRKIAKR
jgi:hypothetical protein